MLFTFRRDAEGRETIHVGDVAIAKVAANQFVERLGDAPGVEHGRILDAIERADEAGFWARKMSARPPKYVNNYVASEVTVDVPIAETTSTILSLTTDDGGRAMTDETAKPRPRGINTHTTVADIAAHKDAIAVFAFTVGHLGSHLVAESHGSVVLWRSIAVNLATIAADIELGGAPLRLNIGDAQTVWYIRDESFAVVVVLAKGSTLGKSVLRMARRSLKTMAAADKMHAVRSKIVADAAVARDIGGLT